MKLSEKQYQGLERSRQTFVKRWVKNPYFDEQKDHRGQVHNPMWDYCLIRFRRYWASEGEPRRHPPHNYRNENNEIGWYFPGLWVDDFNALPATSRQVPRKPTMRSPTEFPQLVPDFPTMAAFQSWRLPPGTIIVAADSTVRYPDGSWETWGDIRARLGGEKVIPPPPLTETQEELARIALHARERAAPGSQSAQQGTPASESTGHP